MDASVHHCTVTLGHSIRKQRSSCVKILTDEYISRHLRSKGESEGSAAAAKSYDVEFAIPRFELGLPLYRTS